MDVLPTFLIFPAIIHLILTSVLITNPGLVMMTLDRAKLYLAQKEKKIP